MENKFFSIKVKKQLYLGNAAIAIYINDCTKKIREKLTQISKKEEKVSALHAESFTSTVNHEMNTPI